MAQMLSLLVVGIVSMAPHAAALKVYEKFPTNGSKDHLVYMHIPHTFGLTIEMHQELPMPYIKGAMAEHAKGDHAVESRDFESGVWKLALLAGKFGEPHVPWGHFNTALNKTSSIGCPLYLTPQKYWPEMLLKQYFGEQEIFAVLRDPYERLVAQFRGDHPGYGSFEKKYEDKCDLNGGIKALMKKILNETAADRFKSGCAFLPQSEYFEGAYGVSLPIDGRRFPASLNEAFEAHGYKQRIQTDHIFRPRGCDDVWAGDLEDDTKALVRTVYHDDFDLICKHFKHCDDKENVCLKDLGMCPKKALQ